MKKKEHILRLFHSIENVFGYTFLIIMALLPGIEIAVRKIFHTGVPGSSTYIQHSVLWVTFVGGMITSREKRHLALTAGVDLFPEGVKRYVTTVTAFIAMTVTWAFAVSSLSMMFVGFDPSRMIGVFPVRLVVVIMPIGYGVMAFRFITGREMTLLRKILLISAGITAGTLLAAGPLATLLSNVFGNVPPFITAASNVLTGFNAYLALPAVILLIISAFFGMPIFIVLGGVAYMLFTRTGGALEVIPNEAYTMLIGNMIPTIPLFTFAGFLLSESKAGERLVTFFKSVLGWLPGGMAVMAIVVCAFFTTFTGASGVTILAVGGILFYILSESGNYSERFTGGLLTASGSIGLLFAPSLPIILYGVVAQVNIKKMFVGGAIPGLVMIIAVSIYAVVYAVRKKTARFAFHGREALTAFRGGLGEILLPFIILIGYFGGFTTIVETGAVAVLYSLLLVLVIHRDIRIRELPAVMLKGIPVIGGVLVILAMARGLSYFIIDAEIPAHLAAWVSAHIHSGVVFLIFLNIALIITGCLMDIFSAIMVAAPLIIPLGKVFGIDPVHLGIIFLANLELGYLTPPVGLNLFLASYRFEQPLSTVYRNVIPFFLVLLITVLLITYFPMITMGPVNFLFSP